MDTILEIDAISEFNAIGRLFLDQKEVEMKVLGAAVIWGLLCWASIRIDGMQFSGLQKTLEYLMVIVFIIAVCAVCVLLAT